MELKERQPAHILLALTSSMLSIAFVRATQYVYTSPTLLQFGLAKWLVPWVWLAGYALKLLIIIIFSIIVIFLIYFGTGRPVQVKSNFKI
jgi:hypothetical protein